ncbi:hypothetical protein BC829DRAFT_474246 [Chytridium lagenaria]|nr:hypothetical protein BC829DRAFT_474246 [Chytridium lagenaria]
MTWAANKTNPLHDLSSDPNYRDDDERHYDDNNSYDPQGGNQAGGDQGWNANPDYNDQRQIKPTLGSGNLLQLPQMSDSNWRISVSSSIMGDGSGGNENLYPSKEVVNRLARASIMSFGHANVNRASILMPITPRALLGRDAPPLPTNRSPQPRILPDPKPEAEINDPRFSTASSVSTSSQVYGRPPQGGPMQRMHVAPPRSQFPRDAGRVPAGLQQFRQEKEEEEQRQIHRMSAQMAGSMNLGGIEEEQAGNGGWAAKKDLEGPTGFELLRRAILSPGAQINQASLFQYIKSLSSVELGKFQRKIHAGALQIRNNVTYAAIETPAKIGVSVSDTLTLVSKSNEARFRFITEPADSRFQITVDPPSGVLNMQGLMLEYVTVTITMKAPVDINTVVILEIDGGYRHYLLVRPVTDVTQSTASPRLQKLPDPQPTSQPIVPQQQPASYDSTPNTSPYTNTSPATPSVVSPPVTKFREPPQRSRSQPNLNAMEVDLVEDMIISGFPHRVPRELALLRGALMAREGIAAEGVFEDQGDPNEVEAIRNRLKQGQPVGSTDPYAISTCIKMFFKESQHPLLAEVPSYLILGAYDEESAWEALGEASQRTFDVITWVLDLLADVVYYEAQNGMGARNICNAWAPVLYCNVGPQKVDQMGFMQVSMQLPPFLGMLLARRMMELDEF